MISWKLLMVIATAIYLAALVILLSVMPLRPYARIDTQVSRLAVPLSHSNEPFTSRDYRRTMLSFGFQPKPDFGRKFESPRPWRIRETELLPETFKPRGKHRSANGPFRSASWCRSALSTCPECWSFAMPMGLCTFSWPECLD
jgi:hypothetical protein